MSSEIYANQKNYKEKQKNRKKEKRVRLCLASVLGFNPVHINVGC